MDNFVELLVIKKKTTTEKALQISIWFGALFFIVLFFLLATLFSYMSVLIPFAVGGIGWLTYRISTEFNIEYEYSLTNGHFDIDKITAKRIRKRLLSTHCKNFEEVGKYKSASHANKAYSTRMIVVGDINSEDLWYFTLQDTQMGYTLVVIEPDDRVLDALKKQIPRQVSKNVFNRN